MLTMTHFVQSGPTPGGVEYHLEHWVSPARGQHGVKTPAAFALWVATSRIDRLVFLPADASCPCGLAPGQARPGPGRVPKAALARYRRPGLRALYVPSRLRRPASA